MNKKDRFILYENNDESILFDTGFHEDTVLHNAKILNKDFWFKVNFILTVNFFNQVFKLQ